MTFPASLLAAAVVGAVVTAATLPPLIRFLRRVEAIDIPNVRSSHFLPTPRGGGISVVLGVCVASACLPGFAWWVPVVSAVVGLGVLGLLEDLRGLGVGQRLLGQVAVSIFVCGLTAVYVEPGLSIAWMLLGVGWLVVTTNTVNFMDGINGLAAGQAVVGGFTFAVLGFLLQSPTLVGGGVLIAATCVGFAPFNVWRARVFLGDVGSYALGGGLGTLALAAFAAGAPILAATAPLLLVLTDTSSTLIRRVRAGHNPFEAHRQHTYQRLSQAGWSHQRISSITTCASAALGGLALATLVPAAQWASATLMIAVLGTYLFLPRLMLARSVRGRASSS